jgi:hypothetical protein
LTQKPTEQEVRKGGLTEADDNDERNGGWGVCRNIYIHLGTNFSISWVIQRVSVWTPAVR